MLLKSDITNKLKKLKWHFAQNKLLLVALIISLLLHALLLSKFTLSLPALDDSHQMLEMRLVKLQPIKQNIVTEKINPTPTSPEPLPSQNLAPETAPITEPPESNTGIPDDTDSQASQQITSAVPSNTEMLPNFDTIEAPNILEENKKSEVYKYVETEFEVHRGTDSSVAGIAIVTFKMLDDATYSITSTTEAKGLASLFFNSLLQSSVGMITENGLRPNRYIYQYGNDDTKKQTAEFAWSDGIVEMHSAKGSKTESIRQGTQDLLSFMYQFMFEPPLDNTQLSVTNGKSLRSYTYSFEGEELVQTRLGELKTVHLANTGEEQSKTELWLAMDYQYIPVKIRKTEKNGSIIEQTMTRLTVKTE